jgi:hypothetical protein
VALAAFGVLWADLIRQLSSQWATYDQYSYAWFVPFLCAHALWRRWADRREPGPDEVPLWFNAATMACLPVYLASRFIHEANPDWPLMAWTMSGAVVVATLWAVGITAGWLSTWPVRRLRCSAGSESQQRSKGT